MASLFFVFFECRGMLLLLRFPALANIVRSLGSCSDDGLMCHFTFTLESTASMFSLFFLFFLFFIEDRPGKTTILAYEVHFELECVSFDFAILTVGKPGVRTL